MRPFVDWLIAAFIFTLVATCALRSSAEVPEALTIESDRAPRLRPAFFYVPFADPLPEAPLTLPDESWCEPIVPLPCEPSSARACPTAPDGTAMRCVSAWFDDAIGSHVCVVGYPSADVRRWRAARLRVLVDAICKRGDGCDPVRLHAYLSTLILRESTWRPYKIHRLAGDLSANARAWKRYADLYRDNPAAGDPGRWSAGRGYFGANAAALLHVWDPNEIPEALCGEVEAVLTHLRTARKMWRRIDAGVRCGGRVHHGTAKRGVSWYDVSLANSGSSACPGEGGRALAVQQGFVRRARSQGLDAYGEVTLAMLGRDVSRDEQRKFASDMRREMGAVDLTR